ncbi:MAG: tetratricopeptide repeat protein [Verrucomicrobiota bacterium]
MSGKTKEASTARNRSRLQVLVPFLAPILFFPGCKPAEKKAEKSGSTPPAVATDATLAEELAGARIDVAKTKLDQKRPDEALSLLVSALKADPTSEEARAMAETILKETTWNLPVLTIDHQLPIEQIHSSPPSSLWVGLSGETNTTVRWNLETLRIEGVLFPVAASKTRSLVFDAGHRWAVVERGPVTLLCNAQTLKPVCDLGPLPDFLTPTSVVVFSADGLLMAHPGFVSAQDHSIVWRLRDSATGQVIRTSDPVTADAPQPLAAWLDRKELRVIHADGSSMEMPVSPVEEIQKTRLPEAVKLLQAQYSLDGNSVLTLQEEGPHQTPVNSVISYGSAEDGSLGEAALTKRFPWSRQPNLWNGLMKESQQTSFWIEGNVATLLTSPHAPIETKTPITAVSFEDQNVITGEENGVLTIHRMLPLPGKNERETKPAAIDKAALLALENLSESLSGIRYEEKERTFTHIAPSDRLKTFGHCRFDAILALFPHLDFSPVIAGFKTAEQRGVPAPAFLPLWDRLAHADSTRKSWPELLKLSKDLAETPWHQQLTAAVLSQAPDHPTAAEHSPWLAPSKMEEIFRSNDSSAILAAIQSAGEKGPAAAAALALALKSDLHERIEACLARAKDLPPLLRQISLSRIAWLQGRKADALSAWPEVFPELAEFRLREDWEGWEQADFKPALDNIRQCVTEELAGIEVPENSTPEQRKTIAERLNDPATMEAVGKRRFAEACLKAALAFSAHKEETETTFQLASLARNMGAPPEPCLRAEALALTALGDYQKAHPRWIELITEHPIETTIPGDYAEGAYTAFENSDPRQAMEILTAGMHRFPNDGNFALRAGWVALLTNNPERAYQFLQAGKRIGFPAEKLENATALLTIAAAQSGAQDDAAVYFQDLLRIDPAWADSATLDTLDWPEELKSILGQFSR